MPGHVSEVYVFDALAVNMNFVFLGQTRDPFGDSPLGSVALIDKRRNDCDPDAWHSFGALPTG
jgi:hypothetical protein